MPRRRKSQAKKPATASASHKDRRRRAKLPLILDGFWSLPKELRHQVLSIACTTDPVERECKAGREGDCIETMMRLSQACREFYAFVMPLLYAHVRLERPSALRLFQQALGSKPALGRFVKSLHIGPEEALPEYWWPICNYNYSGEDNYGFRVNLVDSVDDPSRPDWACPSHDLHFDVEPDCTVVWSKAIGDAFDAASRDLDVDIRHENKDYSGATIGSDAWHVRVLEVQGAMELYAFDTGRCDKEEKKRRGLEGPESCLEIDGPYRRLAVAKSCLTSAADEDDAEEVFRVTRYDVYQRLTRRWTPADHFNHPLLFARSGLPWEAEGPNDIVHRGRGSHPWRSQAHDPADVFSWPAAPTTTSADSEADANEAAAAFPFDLSDSIDPALPSTVTVGGNLALARAVLAFTPLLRTLSLTGFLQYAVVSERAPPAFQALRSVTLGPHGGWGRWLRYGHPTFHNVEKLRVCGGVLALEEIKDIIGDNGLPKLREFYWSDVHRIWAGDEEHLMLTVKNLIGFDDQAAEDEMNADSRPTSCKRRRAAYEALEESDSEDQKEPDESQEGEDDSRNSSQLSIQPHPRTLYIEAHFHADDAKIIIAQAPSSAVAKAWCSGRAVPGQRHRFQLFRHGTVRTGTGLSWDINLVTRRLFKEGREFWDEETAR